LAQAWGTNVTAIRRANGMTPTQTALKLGQRLRVPAGSTKKPAGLGARQPAAAPVAASGTYTVQAGDTVYGIALKTGSSTRAICEANNLDPAKLRINIGQKLIIPGKAPSDRPGGEGGDARTPKAAASPGAKSTQKATAASGRTVTVKSGDTLLSLARANGTTVKALCQANGLNEKATLRIGRNLRIP
jgi:LysM repeat protein